ncbi:choice-of-anchor D domain-containing protein [Botrimarina sp.]|uniref:beta strand repeat-containing protein n=1 Tax=Botrimarina sp. TaxID=2795802 RepID=UPI0032EDD134
MLTFPPALRTGLIAILLLVGPVALGQPRDFDAGGDGTTYTDPANWSDDDVPNSAGESAVIDAGGSFDVVLGATINIGGLTIGADDSLSVNGGITLGVIGTSLANDGLLVINTGATAGNTLLDPNGGELLISGLGELVLNASSDAALQHAQIGAASNDFGVRNGVGHTISGTGQIVTAFFNDGTVVADVAGRTLFVGFANGTNSGLYTADAGGILRIGTSINNTGGLIDSAGGTVQFASGANITGGQIAGADIDVVGTSTFNSLATSASIDVLEGLTLAVNGEIANTGVITVNRDGLSGNTTLDPNTNTTFSGAGQIVLNASSDAALQHARIGAASNDFAVTNGADHTIRGTGQIITTLVNDGSVLADVDGRTLQLAFGTKTNNGTLAATGGGVLLLTNTTIENATGEVASQSGLVQLQGATINGGLLSGDDVRVIGSSTLNALATSAQVDVEAGNLLVVNGDITNTGVITINVDGAAGGTTLDPNSATNFLGDGQVVLNASGNGALQHARVGAAVNDFQITNGADHTFRGTGQIITQFVNNGAVVADVDGRVLELSGGVKTNNGSMTAAGGGVLVLSTTVNNADGLIDSDSGAVRLGGATINGGQLAGADVLVTGTTALNGLTTSAQVATEASLSLTVNGDITNTGIITVNRDGASGVTTLNPDSLTTFSGDGRVVLNASDNGALQHAQVGAASNDFLITNGADHTFQGTGQIINPFVNEGAVVADVDGRVLLLSGGAKTNTGSISATGGGQLVISTAVNNDGGLIDSDSGVLFLRGANITGGQLSGADVRVDAPSTLNNLTTDADTDVLGGQALFVSGNIENSGTIAINPDGDAANTRLDPNSATTFSGTGEIVLNASSDAAPQHARVGGATNDFAITNGAGHTFRGAGDIITGFVNNGTVSADAAGRTLYLSGGVKTNNGVYQAIGGGVLNHTASLTNHSGAGVLTGGSYRAIGAGSTLTLPGPALAEVGPDTEVVLSGAGSLATFGGVAPEASTTVNRGAIRLLDGRDYEMTAAVTTFDNFGVVELGGGTITGVGLVQALANNSGGEFFGFGALAGPINNSGLVRAAGGTLSTGQIAGPGGAVQIDAGASLDLSTAAGASDADTLAHNGEGLNLGANDFLVRSDYTNASFGVGNAFNHRANVTGAGQILADPAVAQTITGDVTGGDTATPSIDFGVTRVGEAVVRSYAVNNAGASGPVLRGAIQTDNTAGNGGSLSDSRLSGPGVTAANFGPLAPGESTGSLAVTFDAATAGALAGQQVAVVNNFDNVANQTIALSGAAYNAAVLGVAPTTIDLGILHVGDAVPGAAITLSNDAAAGAFSEDLRVENFAATGDAAIGAGSPTGVTLEAGAQTSSLLASIDTSTAGAKSGSITFDATSTGEVAGQGVGLTPLALAGGQVMVSAQVNNYAAALLELLSGDAGFAVAGPNEFSLDFGQVLQGAPGPVAELGLTNDAVAPSDDLAGTFTPSLGSGILIDGFGAFDQLAAGDMLAGLLVELDTTTLGDFSGTITLDPRSENASGFSGALPSITINVTGEVVIPEPAAGLLALLASAGLAATRSRSQRVA